MFFARNVARRSFAMPAPSFSKYYALSKLAILFKKNKLLEGPGRSKKSILMISSRSIRFELVLKKSKYRRFLPGIT